MNGRLSSIAILLIVVTAALPASASTYEFITLDNPLATDGQSFGTQLEGINNKGEISGYYSVIGAYNLFVYSNGSYTNLSNPPGVYGYNISGSINNSGEVLGYYNSNTKSACWTF